MWPVESGVVGILLGGVVLLAVVLALVGLVCAIIVLVKMFQNDQALLAIVGLFVPLVLFVVGWIKAKEWRITGTMLVWTLSMVLTPLLVGSVVLATLAGYTMLATESMSGAGMEAAPVARMTEAQAAPDPGNLTQVPHLAGEVLTFEVRGNTTGTIYGTDVYTDESSLTTAAVHAGVLKDGQRGVVRVTILPGQNDYPPSTRNGVTSQHWGPYQSSYRIEAAR
jgi:hypothetical protein